MKVKLEFESGKHLIRPDGDPEKDFEAEGSVEVEFERTLSVRVLGLGDLPENHKSFDLNDPVGRSE